MYPPLKNYHWYPQVWKASEGNEAPKEGTKISYDDYKKGKYVLLKKEQEERFSDFLKKQGRIDLGEDPPDCEVCGNWCEWGYSFSLNPKTNKRTDITCRDCSKEQRREKYIQDRRLNLRLMQDASFIDREDLSERDKVYSEVYSLSRMLSGMVSSLGEDIYKSDLLPQYNELNSRTASCIIDGECKMLMSPCAGRVLLTIEEGCNQLSLIGPDQVENAYLSLQSCNGTFPELVDIIYKFISSFYEKGIVLVEDKKVAYI